FAPISGMWRKVFVKALPNRLSLINSCLAEGSFRMMIAINSARNDICMHFDDLSFIFCIFAS
uniref:hypothetical protein n=1 Tax=Prevotella sp. TaxID=59823 RepID=UPI0040268D68